MDSLVGYGSDDDNETQRYGSRHQYHHSGSAGAAGSSRRREDDTNYDDVNMDMSEDSGAESDPQLPQADSAPSKHHHKDDRRGSADSRERDRDRDRNRDRNRERERDHKRRDSPSRRPDRGDRRSPRREDKYRSDRERSGRRYDAPPKRGLLGDRPSDRAPDKPPALMDLKPYGDAPHRDRGSQDARDAVNPRSDRDRSGRRYDAPPKRGLLGDMPSDRAPDKPPALMDLKPYGDAPHRDRGSQDARDAVNPRFSERNDRRDRERDRDRDRERDRDRDRGDRSSHSSERSRGPGGRNYPPPAQSTRPLPGPSMGREPRGSPPPSGDYRPSSYKVNKKLEVMEKMGLQIKTPDGSMATAQQLRQAASDAPAQSSGLPYFNNGLNSSKILDQVQKRKLLWANKNKNEAEEAAKWSGTRFAQDSDGRQVNKFMRLMGIKEPEKLKPENTDKAADPIKKQEELFQAMQAQYEVARATTHTMRGVGLGFQRGQF